MRKVLTLLCIMNCALCINISAQDDYLEWGYYGGDGSDLEPLGNGATGYGVAIFVPGNGSLKGGKIAGMKIPVRDGAAIYSVKGWISTDEELTPTLTTEQVKAVPDSDIPVGVANDPTKVYITVMFDSAFAIPVEGCYLGYSFEVKVSNIFPDDWYPILLDYSTFNDRGLYLYANNLDEWAAYGAPDFDMGVSGVKALVAGVEQVDLDVTFSPFLSQITCIGKPTTVPVAVNATSTEDITSIEYRISVGDHEEIRTAEVSIPKGTVQQEKIDVEIPVPSVAEEYTVNMSVLKANGKENSSKETVTPTVCRNVSRLIDRNTLAEELTGTRCGWCPRGLVGMEVLQKEYGERFIGIAIHQFTPSTAQDAMYFPNYRRHYMSSAPALKLDNKINLDPYDGTGKYENIIGDFNDYCSIPPLADINLTAEWTDATKTEVRIDAEVEGLCKGDYTISYALVANNLHGTTSAWAQSNYMSAYDPVSTTIKNDPNLIPYAKGGQYGQEAIYPYFNDVLIGSSYDESKQNLTDALGTLTAGEPVSNSYTISLPTTPATLVSQLKANLDKIYAVAVVWDKNDEVVQAKKVPVTVSTGIVETRDERRETKVDCTYNLAGQKVADEYKGVVLKNGKKVLR